MGVVLVPRARIGRWVSNFVQRHGATSYTVRDGALAGLAEDGSDFVARLPFGTGYAGPPVVDDFTDAVTAPEQWGVLLVRKGGFAVARLQRERIVDSKVGQRHVQGRTKAGGQSQQRFARRRGNQARQAYEAAAEHTSRILPGELVVVTGGDRTAVAAVLEDPRLRGVTVVPPWLDVPDPRRAVLEQAARDGASVRVEVRNTGAPVG